MAFVIATKRLTDGQKNLLIQSGLEIADYNAIDKYPLEKTSTNVDFPVSAIVSSAYGTQLLLKQNPRFDRLYVVGKQSAKLLQSNDFQPNFTAENAAQLADFILRNHPKEKALHFFCSQQRRNELPDKLTLNSFHLEEIYLYRIRAHHVIFQRKVDAVLFLSPSAVRSFCDANDQRDFVAFCIGNTTAIEAKKYRLEVKVPKSTSYESLIATCVKHFRS